ncbi:MAG: DUF935 family protein [Desulfobacterium sp.]|nr:DUF935 family protein [Desulfobacterium sp.]
MAEANIKKPLTPEIAIAEKDIDIFSGWLNRMENPDPVLRSEATGKGLKLYDEVARDPHAAAVLQSRYLAIAGCEWEVQPADESAKAKEVAEFVESALRYANFTQALQELMQATLYGFFVAEILWGQKDGAWVPEKIIGKHPRRFSFDMNRELRLLTPANTIDGESVPDRKFIVFSYGSSDNPYGCGLGQKLWWPVWFKKNGIKFWLVFLEKFGMPTGHGKYPPGTDAAGIAKLVEALDAIHSETGIATPDTMEIELLEAARSGNVTYESLCDYMDRQVSKAVLGQTLTTEVKGEGSLAAGKVHNDVRQDLKKADADLLSEVVNDTLVHWIVDYNFAGVEKYPTLWLRTEEEEDLKPLAERDEILSRIGLKIPTRYFYDTYGIPEPDAKEDVVAGSGSAHPEKEPPVNTKPGEFAEKPGFTPEQQAIEGLADQGVEKAGALFADHEKKILEAVLAASSYEDAQIRLLSVYPDLDTQGLSDLLERSLVTADLFGRYTVGEEIK